MSKIPSTAMCQGLLALYNEGHLEEVRPQQQEKILMQT